MIVWFGVLVPLPEWQSNSTYCSYILLLWKLRLPPFDAQRLSKSEAYHAPCCGGLRIYSRSLPTLSIRGKWYASTTHPPSPWVLGWGLGEYSWKHGMGMSLLASPLPTFHLPAWWLSLHLKQDPLGTTVSTHMEHGLCLWLWLCSQVS